MIAWWAHVTVTPEPKRIAVLSNGIWKGLNALIPKGGQSLPISTRRKTSMKEGPKEWEEK